MSAQWQQLEDLFDLPSGPPEEHRMSEHSEFKTSSCNTLPETNARAPWEKRLRGLALDLSRVSVYRSLHYGHVRQHRNHDQQQRDVSETKCHRQYVKRSTLNALRNMIARAV